MLIIVGDIRAGELFGKVFPKTDYVHVKGSAKINAQDCAVIVKEKGAEVLNARGVVVEENAQCMFPRGVQLIACGNSPKNTVSITSRTGDKITLALNRSLKTKSGICEPLELPVPFEQGFTEFDYMSAFASWILEK